MHTIERARLGIAGPADFASNLPRIVGFPPKDSLVVALLKESFLEVTMRADIHQDWKDTFDQLERAITNTGSTDLVLAVCTSRGGRALPHLDEVNNLLVRVEALGCTIRDALLIDENRYWSYLDPRSDQDPGTGFEALNFTAAEGVCDSRELLVHQYRLRPDLQPTAESYERAQEDLSSRPLERARQAWQAVHDLAVVDFDTDLSVMQDAQALVQVAAQHVQVRDYLLGNIALAAQPGAFVGVMTDLAVCAPPEHREQMAGAAAALLAAFDGSNVPAAAMCDHAGDNALAVLVRRSMSAAFPPREIRNLLAESLPRTMELLEAGGQA